jgi:hypothetical protein
MRNHFLTQAPELNTQHSSFFTLFRDLLSQGIPARIKVSGISMSPFIEDEDIVVVSPFQKTSPSIGQVVAFIHPVSQRLTVHRILSSMGDLFYLKGDNGLEADGLVPRANILGYVKKVIRNGNQKSFGLGAEGILIALLSLGRLLAPFSYFFSRVNYLIKKTP